MGGFVSAIGADSASAAGLASAPWNTQAGPASASPSISGGDNSGWLAGIGSLFGSVASGVSGIIRSSNTPDIAPVYGRGYLTPTNANPSLAGTSPFSSIFNNPLLLILLGVLIFLLVRKKRT